MVIRSWSSIIDATAKRLELAAMFDATVEYDAKSSAWLARVLREMARIMDRDAKDRGVFVTSFRVLGFTITVKRDEAA